MKHAVSTKLREIFGSSAGGVVQKTEQEADLLTKEVSQDSFNCSSSILPNIVIDKLGNFISANQAFKDLVCAKEGQLKNGLLEYLDDHSRSALGAHLEQEFVSDKVLEVKFTNDAGTYALMYLLVQGENLNCILIDITSYKNLELHLIHSQKMQAVGQLAGGISHDFNNLLTAIIGFSDLLLMKHPAGDPSFAEIMQIKQNSNRAANLVRQLLAISRKQVLKPMVLDITNTLEELVNLIRRLIGDNVSLSVTHGQNLRTVKVDQGQLEQVIINLAVNARDAILWVSEKGSLSISTSNIKILNKGVVGEGFISPDANEKILPGDYVLVEVQDSGSGIPKSIIAKIFEPFFSTKAVGAGTGLGLSTVYGIIKQTGGYLYLKSEEGVGTIFHIYLKAADKKDGIEECSAHQDVERKIVQKDLTGNATILLVEDEMPVRMFATSALSNKGYNVMEADCPETALKLVAQCKGNIDLVLTDVLMPGMTGPAMIKEIREKLPNVRVIFMSGYAEDAFADEGGTNFHFLSKPFTLKQLALKIKEVLEA